MTMQAPPRQSVDRIRPLAFLVVCLVMLANCAQAPASPSPSLAPSAVSPVPFAPTVRIDGIVAFTYPDTWSDLAPKDLRDVLSARVSTATGAMLVISKRMIDDIDHEVIRKILISPASAGVPSATVIVSVESGDASLTDAVARRRAANAAIEDVLDVQVTQVVLPIGPATMIETLGTPAGAGPTHGIEYILRLDSGATVSVYGTAPPSMAGFNELMETVAMSLTRA